MQDLNHFVSIYKEQLQKQDIQIAYIQLIKFISRLKIKFSKELAHKYSFNNIFQGYMDYSYFYYSNSYLKEKRLKLGLVLNHKNMTFEIWLLGNTKDIQKKYWNLLKNTKWINNLEIPQYSIFEITIIENPNFNDLDLLSEEIKDKLIEVSNEILSSLKKNY